MKLLRPLVTLDFETTGVETFKDRIVQAALYKEFPDGNTDERCFLINPGVPIPKEASDVHGITDEMVADAKPFRKIAVALNDFLTGCDLAGFNSNKFDLIMLQEEFMRCNIEFPSWELSLVDVLRYESVLNPRTLSAVYKKYTGEELSGAHDALIDVRGTRRILEHQTADNPEITAAEIDLLCQGDKQRVDLSGHLYRKDDVVHFGFGKHANRSVADTWKTDRSYFTFIWTANFPSEVKRIIKNIVEPGDKLF